MALVVVTMLLPGALRAANAPAWVTQYQPATSSGYMTPVASRMLVDGSFMEVIKLDFGGLFVATRYSTAGVRLTTTPPFVVDDYSARVVIGPFGEIYGVATRTVENSGYSPRIYAWKYDGYTGNAVWTAPAVATSAAVNITILAADLDTHGNLIAAGRSSTGIVAAKWSGVDGNPLWVHEYDATDVQAMEVAADDTIALTGATTGAVRTIKLDTAGTAVWTRDFPVGSGLGKAIAVASDGAVSVVASGEVVPGDVRIITIHYAPDGTQLWSADIPTGGAVGTTFVRCDPAGNTIVAATKDATNDDFVVRKYTTGGGVVWTYNFATIWDESVAGITLDGSGNVIATTSTLYTTTAYDVTVVKLASATGAVLWNIHDPRSQRQGSSYPVIDPAGNVFVTADSTASPVIQTVTIKVNGTTGAILWTDVHPLSRGSAVPVGAVLDSAANVITAVSTQSPTTDIAAAKYSGDTGSLLWSWRLNSTAFSTYARAIAVDASDNIYIAGDQYSTDAFVLVKLSSTGVLQWSRTIPVSSPTTAAIAVDNSGNVIVIGDYMAGSKNVLTMKYDPSGVLQWQMTFDFADDSARAVTTDASGNIIAAVQGGSLNWKIIKFAPNGSTSWIYTFSNSVYSATPAAVVTNAAGDVFVTGEGLASGVLDDFTTVRLDPADGHAVWTKFYSGVAGTGYDSPRQVIVDGSDVIVAGFSTLGGVTPYDYVVVRYAQADGTQQSVIRYPGTLTSALYQQVFIGVGTTPGDLVLAGLTHLDTRRDSDLTVVRFDSTGAVTDGPLYIDRGWEDRPVALAMSGDKMFVAMSSGHAAHDAYTLRIDKNFSIVTFGDQLPPAFCGQAYNADVVASNGNGALTWSIVSGSLPSGLTLNAATGNISGTPTGAAGATFRVRATDATAAFVERDFTIAVNSAADYFRIVSSQDPSCGPTTLSVPPGYTAVQWLPGLETTPTIQIDPAQPAVYGVIANQGGACITRGAIELAVTRIVAPSLSTSTTPLCPSSAIVSVPPDYVSYDWSVQNGTITSGQGTNSIQILGTTNVGVSVQVINASGCSATASTTVPLQPVADPVLYVNTSPVCPNSSFQVWPTKDFLTYDWTVTNGTITGGQGTAVVTITAGPSGTVGISLSALGCDNATHDGSTNVTLASLSDPTITITPATACPNGTVQASVPADYSSYTWSVTNGTISGGQGTPSVTITTDPLASGQVDVSVSVVACDSSTHNASASAPIAALPPPAITAPPEICPMGSGTASVPALYSTYFWEITNGTIGSSIFGDSISFYPDGSGPVQLQVTVTNASGCQTTASASVPLKTIPPPVITAPAEVCPLGSGTASVPPDYQYYDWTIVNGSIGSATPYSNSIVFYPNGNGPMQLSVRVLSPDYCEATANATVQLKTIPAPVITAPTEVCPLGSGTASVPPDYQYYDWTIVNGSIGSPQPYSNSIVFYPDGNGPMQLSVRVLSPDYCEVTANATVQLKTIPPPVITPFEPEVCPNNSSFASVPADYQYYSWTITNGTITSGDTSPTVYFTAGSSGPVTLNVTVTDAGYCSSSNQIVIPTCIPDPVVSFASRSTDGTNTLMWANPVAGAYESTMIRMRTDGVYPTDPTDGQLVGTISGVLGGVGTFTHSFLANDVVYRYAAFAQSPTGHYSTYVLAPGRPQVTTGPAKWVYNTGATTMTPPGISGAIYAVSNDRILHSMRVAAAGGDWPAGWRPPVMNAPSQARPIVAAMSINQINGASKVAFVSSQDGYVYAINANTGAELWSSQIGESVQAAPSAALRQNGSTVTGVDLVLAGTRNTVAPNGVYALNTQGGVVVWSYTGGGVYKIGIIGSQLSIDAVNRRIYFASRAASPAVNENHTLWCLTYDGTSVTRLWSVPLGDIDGSPIVRSNTLYIGTNDGTAYAINPNDGSVIASYATGDGPVKGFIFSDPPSLYFSTTNKVWRVIDNLTAPRTLTPAWSVSSIASPSTAVLTGAGLYVGSSDGRLYRLTALTNPSPTITSAILGDGSAAVGAIGYDFQNGLAYVGTAAGAIYAVTNP